MYTRSMVVSNMKLLVIGTLLALSCAQEIPERRPVKRSYVCPPKFVRQGHRCYYFSKERATWQDAHFHCRDMHSNIAIVKNSNQDKLIRSFLSKKSLVPHERWLGGVYDWKKMAWKWAASGKPLTYNGFHKKEKESREQLRWHCIVMDPALHYRWTSRSCLEQKHYICHTKLKILSSKGKKKLSRQYNVDKNNKLNEIPVPNIPDYLGNSTLKSNTPVTYHVEVNQSLNDQPLFALRPQAEERRSKRGKKKRKAKHRQLSQLTQSENSKDRKKNRGNNMDVERPTSINHIKWKTYKEETNANPLYPKPIVEEYNYVRER